MKKSILACSITLLLFISDNEIWAQGRIKLFRFGERSNEKPGVLTIAGRMLDVSGFGEDFNGAFFASDGIMRLEKWLEQNETSCPEVASHVRLAPCVSNPSKIVGIGLNYVKHAQEAGVPVPREPILFLKSTTSLSGPNDPVAIPPGSAKTDWEVELAIIIGKRASYVPEERALDFVAGFSVINDYSERAYQLESTGQWTKGKSEDTFGPLGPFLVTLDAVGDVQNLKLWLKVNGETMQASNTGDMVFDVKHLVSYVSTYMTLMPGDVIATGTPSGVGSGQKPQRFLKVGDVIELGIEKIGQQKQVAVDATKNILGDEAYRDYQAWLALGKGGLPSTLEGYRTVKMLAAKSINPRQVDNFSKDIGTSGDIKTLGTLPIRRGPRPVIAPFVIPHRQTDQHNDSLTRKKQKGIFDAQVAEARYKLMYKMSFFEKQSPAIFLLDSASGNPALMPTTHAEVGHMHPSDGSMHVILSPSDAKIVMESGWGELHSLAGQARGLAKTYMMVYSPRDERELSVTKRILEAGVKYARHVPK